MIDITDARVIENKNTCDNAVIEMIELMEILIDNSKSQDNPNTELIYKLPVVKDNGDNVLITMKFEFDVERIGEGN